MDGEGQQGVRVGPVTGLWASWMGRANGGKGNAGSEGGAGGRGSPLQPPAAPRGARLQIRYLNTYYKTIRARVGPELQQQQLEEEYRWLQRNTEPFPLGSAATATAATATLGTLALASLLSALLAGLQA